jgi:hypothetical protein
MNSLFPLFFLFEVDTEDESAVMTEKKAEEAPEEEEIVRCSLCHEMVTNVSEKMSVSGGHQHVFTNPHGYIFEIGCFRNAPGCLNVGDSTGEFTWFSGYVWCYAVCRHCHSHLGWLFENGKGDAFYGLILKKLIFP